ncbi:amidase signature domain-containing protein [Lophiotrema nucula]|uniref:Amidase signature domain-containing protein n=1 Tax=Lophiotrema nucula TaxID=690887 RepID=A0A6A5YJF9_9PLEO|nr:amidase signature domain-containing protein [Lophiotrema nucula]
MPANRAGLYTIKPTIGLISTDGIVPASDFSDTAGPLAKSVQDLADLLQIMVDPAMWNHVPEGGYRSSITSSWAGLKVGFLAPHEWPQNEDISGPDAMFNEEQQAAVEAAYKKIEAAEVEAAYPVWLKGTAELNIEGESALNGLWQGNLNRLITDHLSSFEQVAVQSLKDIVGFNLGYSVAQLPAGINQQYFLDSLNKDWSKHRSEEVLRYCRHAAGTEGIDHVMQKHGIDVIIGPADSDLDEMLSASGYPAVTLPLGVYSGNGRPFGLLAIASKFQEALLVRVASAWEALFPNRPTPNGILMREAMDRQDGWVQNSVEMKEGPY